MLREVQSLTSPPPWRSYLQSQWLPSHTPYWCPQLPSIQIQAWHAGIYPIIQWHNQFISSPTWGGLLEMCYALVHAFIHHQSPLHLQSPTIPPQIPSHIINNHWIILINNRSKHHQPHHPITPSRTSHHMMNMNWPRLFPLDSTVNPHQYSPPHW